MCGFNCARLIRANGVTHLKSCVWRWDYKSRVTISLKLFISCVIALLPPGYFNSLLYLSLWMKSPHLKIITASSRCALRWPLILFSISIAQHGKKKPGHISWELLGPLHRESTLCLYLLGLTNSVLFFIRSAGKCCLGDAVSQHNFSFGNPAVLHTSLWAVSAGCSGSSMQQQSGSCWRRYMCPLRNELLWPIGPGKGS